MDLKLPTLNEVIAILISVILGTSAYLGYTIMYKRKKVNWNSVLWILSMNTFLTFVVSEFMKLKDWGGYRTVFLPVIAYAGQYAMIWFDKRNEKIFDSLAGKANINTTDRPIRESRYKKDETDEEPNEEYLEQSEEDSGENN